MKTLDDVTNTILGAVLQSTTLEQALYPRAAAAPLGIDVHGDEHENPNQPYRPSYTTTDADISARTRRAFMRSAWGLSDEEIDRLEARTC